MIPPLLIVLLVLSPASSGSTFDGDGDGRADPVIYRHGEWVFPTQCTDDCQHRSTTLWYPYAEWSFENSSWDGNPFDLEAAALFSDGIEAHLFYDGGTTWKLRYMCTEVGEFDFRTSSEDPDLDGLSGTLVCDDRPGAMGLLGARGRAFWVRGWERAIVPYWGMMPGLTHNSDRASEELIDAWIAGNIDDLGFSGAHDSGPANAWYDFDCDGTRSGCQSENPDPRTFAAYERLLDKLYRHDAFLHVWMFWDCQRDKCDKYRNDPIRRRRLRHYLADRWGAIPNWMMGEGFDNYEDDSPAYANTWFHDLDERLPWKHLLGMRSAKNPYPDGYGSAEICDDCNYASWENLEMTFDKFSTTYQARVIPPFEEDRFRVRFEGRDKDIETVEQQRRHMWWQVMSGGVGAIYGYLDGSGGQYSLVEGYPDAWAVPMKTWKRFWTGRYTVDLEVCAGESEVRVLCNAEDRFIFFAEDTRTLTMDLSQLSAPRPAVAVDTNKEYVEIPLGTLVPGRHTWSAPHQSDWAVAVDP